MSAPTMKSLFAAAREDALPREVHERVWGGVATATAAGAAAKAASPAAVATKVAVAAVGAIATACAVALALVATEPVGGAPRAAQATRGDGQHTPSTAPVVAAQTPSPTAISASSPAAISASSPATALAAVAPASPRATSAVATAPRSPTRSALDEEARLVTEARAALVGDEPERALALARRTHRLPARRLGPEELALEARALRALGRAEEALATELALRSRFPDHALSR